VPAAGEPPLRVLAAASLTEVVQTLARDSAGRVALDVGASSVLARRVRDGAPADVFLSASADWMAFLAESGRLDGAPVVFARNALVAVAPERERGLAPQVADARALLGALAPTDRVAVADEGVPAGQYARRALASQGLLDAFRAHLVGMRDVRAVLHAVEQGEVRAGIVYATDARVGHVELLFAFDPAHHPDIAYHAAVLRGASQPERARRFVEHLGSAAARRRLAAAGFTLP